MLTLIYFCIVLGLLVTVHEFGHFAAAKLCGVFVDRFSIGFGPALLKYKGKETTYLIACIPLGGYVQMAGQSDLPDEEQAALYKDVAPERFYTAKNVWQRLLIIIAGPMMNLLFALPLALALLCYGQNQIILPKGLVVSEVVAESPAEKAGLQKGDRIIALNGSAPESFETFTEEVRQNLYHEITLTVERAGQKLTLTATPELNEAKKYLGLGFGISPFAQIEAIETNDTRLQKGDVVLGIEGIPEEDTSFTRLSETIRRYPGTNLLFKVASYPKSRLASEPSQVYPSEVEVKIGARNKCRDFDIIKIEGKPRLLLRPDAPEELFPFDGARVLYINDRALNLSEEDFFSTCTPGPVTLAVAASVQKGNGVAREMITTSLVSRVEVMGHAGVILRPATEMVRQPFLSALKQTPAKAFTKVTETINTLALLFKGSLKVNNLSGPVGIARMTGAAASRGFDVLLNFVLLITVNLGILNLLPLPVLDGGHVVLLLCEAIIRKPLPEKFLLWYQRAGLLLLLGLFALVMWNDLARWIGDSEFLGQIFGKIFR